jgi:hypothetical protein
MAVVDTLQGRYRHCLGLAIGHLFNDAKVVAADPYQQRCGPQRHCLGSLWRGRTPTQSTITGYVVNDLVECPHATAVVRAGLTGALDSDEVNLTLFALTTSAFGKVPRCVEHPSHQRHVPFAFG